MQRLGFTVMTVGVLLFVVVTAASFFIPHGWPMTLAMVGALAAILLGGVGFMVGEALDDLADRPAATPKAKKEKPPKEKKKKKKKGEPDEAVAAQPVAASDPFGDPLAGSAEGAAASDDLMFGEPLAPLSDLGEHK